ncbi:Protein RIK [Mucuna pruriens]|uniref:Protein RIK n=1 Tax=Mucuna pruriens TaxID=157652 RepID=A0A371GS47_MUCPR|nr:Protein RIK [Mucuna pruriens]
MTEDSSVRVSSSDESSVANDASQTRQRKKRKWDQPAELLVPVGMTVPGALPLSNAVSLGGAAFPGVAPVISSALLTNPLAASAHLPQHTVAAAAAVQKLNQQKIQDELIIAREIVINDAESSVRYKLTKRQTQEEIQRCTGAIVITRGKYRPPNAPLDGEKPLYLHISAGAHIKETAERILAVDRAAAMIEEMLKQGQNSQSISSASPSTLVNGLKALTTCVFLGFDADPSLNIVARIRGPNDQYINHIMNETGATVVLRGHGSGNNECLNGEDGQQPLHLFLSSNNAKSLDDAKFLAENLLDTICTECGASRVSSCKVYSAVPPPQQVYTAVPPPQQVYSAVPPPQQVYSGPSLLKQVPTAISPPQQVYSAVPPPHQLLTGVQSSGIELEAGIGLTTSSMSATVVVPPASLVGMTGVTAAPTLWTAPQSTGHLNSGPQANMIGYTPPLVSGGTSYIGYGGIYPQATPLQQVALALRHSPPVASTVAPTTSALNYESKSTSSSDLEKEKRPPQKRKFQELPVCSKGTTKLNQVFSLTFYEAKSLTLDLSVGPFGFQFWRSRRVPVALQHMPLPMRDVIFIFSFTGKIAAKDAVACFLAMPSSSPAYMDCQFAEGNKISDSKVVFGFLFSSTLTQLQGMQPLKPNEQSDSLVVRSLSTMPVPKKLVQPSSNGMPTLLPRTIPPPPPPRFSDPSEVKVQDKNKNLLKTKSDAVPDTLVKLMEYGEDDDDLDDSSEELSHATRAIGVQKPFWAL